MPGSKFAIHHQMVFKCVAVKCVLCLLFADFAVWVCTVLCFSLLSTGMHGLAVVVVTSVALAADVKEKQAFYIAFVAALGSISMVLRGIVKHALVEGLGGEDWTGKRTSRAIEAAWGKSGGEFIKGNVCGPVFPPGRKVSNAILVVLLLFFVIGACVFISNTHAHTCPLNEEEWIVSFDWCLFMLLEL